MAACHVGNVRDAVSQDTTLEICSTVGKQSQDIEIVSNTQDKAATP
jgi:cysteinyl-tRNA synthetase